MHQSIATSCSIRDFCSQYGDYLFRVRGLSASTRKLHRHVVCKFLTFRFPDGEIILSKLRFSDLIDFLKGEFARLSSRESQRAWLTILRSVLRYLSEAGQIPKGWEGALPKVANHTYARLPKNLSQEQTNALRAACRGEKPRHFRNRALLLLFLRLGLRVQEVAGLTPSDIDWKNGHLKVRCTKTYNDRILPIPQDVGRALVAHLRKCRSHPERIFEPLRPPFTAERSYTHVLNSIRYVFGLAGINDRGAHSLRHTAATEMVNSGISFKDVADVLGHKSITTTFIYKARYEITDACRTALARRCTMNITKLSAYLEEFLALKRAMAEADPHYDAFDRRSIRHKEKLLKNFLAFWYHHGRPWPIRAAHVLDWIAVESHPQHPYRGQHCFYTLRAFLQQVRAFEPGTEVPDKIFKFRRPRRTPHLFSEPEIVQLMRATRRLRLFETFRPLTLRTMIGLLASTGLRIGEVLRLKVEDARLTANPPYLLIYETKFGKSRNVVLHPTTAHRLRRYLVKRGEILRNRFAETFFTNISGKPLGYTSTRSTFRRLLRHAGIQLVPGQRAPSLHSFRHTFTVARLTRWHLERRNVQELLPHLSVYLGHVGPENTYWYLTATPELLQTASVLFDRQQSQGAAKP